MNILPDELICIIIGNLDYKSKTNLFCASKRFNGMKTYSDLEIACCSLHDIIKNNGNNYSIQTDSKRENGYVLNVFNDLVVLHQKWYTACGTTIYIRILSADRNCISSSNVIEIIKKFRRRNQKIEAKGHFNNWNINKCVEKINSYK